MKSLIQRVLKTISNFHHPSKGDISCLAVGEHSLKTNTNVFVIHKSFLSNNRTNYFMVVHLRKIDMRESSL